MDTLLLIADSLFLTNFKYCALGRETTNTDRSGRMRSNQYIQSTLGKHDILCMDNRGDMLFHIEKVGMQFIKQLSGINPT